MAATPLPVTPTNVAFAWQNLLLGPLQNCQSYSALLQQQVATNNGQFGSQTLLNLLNTAGQVIANVNTISANNTLVTAIIPYIQQQVGNPTLGVAASFNAITAALQALINAGLSEFPKDSNGNLLYQQMNSAGVFTFANFAASAFPNTSAALTAWLATIT